MGKKRPLVFETMGTNTGLNMQNEPGVGRRLGANHIYNPFVRINTLREGGVNYNLFFGAWILQRQQTPATMHGGTNSKKIYKYYL